jgi:hypothetical protein
LKLRESTLERNTARGGGILPAPGRGGGVASSGPLVIDASTFSENLASGGLSGMSSNNLAPAAEGAGGAVYALSASVLATNSTFASNRVIGSSQCSFLCPTNGIPSGDGRGGALAFVSNSAVLVNLTLAFNRAEPGALGDTNTGGAFGGAIANLGSTLTLRNSIVASNAPLNIFGPFGDAGFNLSSDHSFLLTGTGSRTNTDPRLGPLTTNGGPTHTMALLPGSPARDVIPANSVPRVDQRGEQRPIGPGGDVGAFEFVPTVPEFVLSPTSADVRVGTNIAFQANASGATPLGYFWLKDGTPIPNTTNATLILSNVQTNDAGNYATVATNSFGAVTSAVATLTVDARPLIRVQPADATVPPSGQANFSVAADGPSLAYSWLHNDMLLPGETNAMLTVTNAQPGAQGQYQVIVTNFAGAATSRVATLTFNALALSIIVPPQNVSANEGQPARFTVVVSGIGPFTYQWFFGSNVVADTTDPAPTNELFFASVASTNAGTYRVVVTNAYNALTSAPATLTIDTPPVFTLQPTGGVARLGSNFTFQVLAAGRAPIAYFWLKNGLLLPDATGSTLFLANVQETNAGAYAAIATNTLGAVTSLVATLTLDLTPLIVSEPGDVRVAPGANTNFVVSADGSDLTYTWLQNNQLVAGATNAVLSITNAAPSDRGTYQVIITNLFGAATSRLASLTFDTNALVIVTQPTNVLVQMGQTATFTVVVAGVTPFAYQWLFGGTGLVDETNSTLAIPNVTDTNAGSYRVVITNAYLAVTSALATLTIDTNAVPAPLLVSPTLTLFLRGETLVITCEGTPGKTYRLLSSETLTTDAAAWNVEATEEMPASGTVTWTLLVRPNGLASHFYRAASP